MRQDRRIIHFHIGLDGVFDSLFTSIFHENPVGQNCYYFSDEEYRRDLREFIDGGNHTGLSEAIKKIDGAADTVAISRHRLLFDGSPSNLGGISGLYKLGVIQEGLDDFQLVFHLFLCDHLAYLFRSFPSGNFFHSQSDFSWLPLVQAIALEIRQGHQLLVWGAEGRAFVERFVSEILHFPAKEASSLSRKIMVARKDGQHELEERFAEKIGLDPYDLDVAYERDIEAIRRFLSQLGDHISHRF